MLLGRCGPVTDQERAVARYGQYTQRGMIYRGKAEGGIHVGALKIGASRVCGRAHLMRISLRSEWAHE